MQPLIKKILFSFCCIVFAIKGFGQLPVCSGPGSGLIYYVDAYTTNIYNYDPTQPISSTNPIS